MEQVARIGAYLERGLRAIASRQPAIKDVRGAGVMWGIEIDRPAAAVVEAALQRQLLDQPHVRHGGAAAAALRDYRTRDRRSAAAARSGDCHGGGGAPLMNIQLRTGVAADATAIHALDRREPQRRPPAAAHVRGHRVARRTASSSPSRTTRSSAAASWRRSAPKSPRSARSSSTRRAAASAPAWRSSPRWPIARASSAT